MGKNENQAPGAGEDQVFELTMGNPDTNQVELNRQLRKPGEPDRCLPAKIGGAAQAELTTASPKSSPGDEGIPF